MLRYAYRHSIGTTQLLLQAIDVGLRNTGLVGVVKADNTANAQEGRDEHSQVEEALAGADVGVLLGTEDTENFIVLVDRLAKVALLLLVPPAAVGISVLTLHAGGVLVTAILEMSVNIRQLTGPAKRRRLRCKAIIVPGGDPRSRQHGEPKSGRRMRGGRWHCGQQPGAGAGPGSVGTASVGGIENQ